MTRNFYNDFHNFLEHEKYQNKLKFLYLKYIIFLKEYKNHIF